jgi:hypothetical protein
VYHARKAQILNVCGAASHFGGDVDAPDRVSHYSVLVRVLQCRLRRRHNVQSLAGNEFSVGISPPTGRNDAAALGSQLISGNIGAARRLGHKNLAHLSGSVEDCRATVLHGVTAGGVALVRRKRRVGGDEAQCTEFNVELLRCDL